MGRIVLFSLSPGSYGWWGENKFESLNKVL